MAEKKGNTHIVIKIADFDKHLNDTERSNFSDLVLKIHRGRLRERKIVPMYYICNIDEPYADKVLQVILDGEDEKVLKAELAESQTMVKEVIEDFCTVARLVGTYPTKDDYKYLCALETKWLKIKEKIL